jgi:hypothetical protein
MRSFSAGRRTVMRNPSARRRTTRPCASSSSARSAPRTTAKLPADGGQSNPAASRAARIRSLSAIVSSTSSCGLRSAAAAMRADGAETGAGSRRRSSSRAIGRGDCVTDTQGGEAERLRGVRMATRFGVSAISGATVFPPYSKYALVHDDHRLRIRPGECGDLLRLDELPGRVVRIAEPDEIGLRRVVGELGASIPSRPRRRSTPARGRGPPAGPGNVRAACDGPSAPAPGTTAQARRRRRQTALRGAPGRSRRVLVPLREALPDRHLRNPGQRRDVLVEADDRGGVQPVPRGNLLERRRPGVGPKPVRKRPGRHGRPPRQDASNTVLQAPIPAQPCGVISK